MTPDAVSALVERELAEFRYDPPAPDSGLLGTSWSAERVARGIDALRAALVPPRPVALRVQAFGTRDLESREAWAVAEVDGLLVVYDVVACEFALAELAVDGEVADINVRGDLVGTFLAA